MKEKTQSKSSFEQVFARLGRQLSATANAVTAAEIILNAANELIGWDACYLVLYDPQQGGKPRPLLAIDTIGDKFIVQHDAAPERPSEYMLRAIREGGFLALHEAPYPMPPGMTFGNRTRRTLSQLFVPVRSEARTIGVLSIQSYLPRAYDEDALATLNSLANHCAGALERIWAQETVAHLAERLKALHRAAHAISASLDMEELCAAVHRAVESVMPCDDFVIDGYDPATNEIVPIYAIEYPHRRVATERYYADHGLAGYIVHTRQPLMLNSPAEMAESGIVFEYYGSQGRSLPQSLLAVPMLMHGNVNGMISAQSRQPNAYTMEDRSLLELLASHAAIALENSRLFAAVQRLADTDSLTGAFSRRKFFELSEREFVRMKRYGSPLSVIMIDVDEFKKFNDRYGHQVGDAVLKLVAERCKTSLRGADILGRLGGEEFAVTLPETGLEQAARVASRLCSRVREADLEAVTGKRFEKEAVRVTISAGVAACDESCSNIETLLDRADRAMYAGKYAGKDRIHIWNNGAK